MDSTQVYGYTALLSAIVAVIVNIAINNSRNMVVVNLQEIH